MISIDELKALASAQAEAIARICLPNGRREGPYWATSNIADVHTGRYSLKVTLEGGDRGMWCDYGAGTGGNILQLVAEARFRGDIKDAIAWVKSFLGLDGLDPGRLRTVRAEATASIERDREAEDRKREGKRRKALNLFLDGVPIFDTPAEFYFLGRGVDFRALGHSPGCLRFHPEVWNEEAKRRLPCVLASVITLQGSFRTVHRHWLAPDGKGGWTKADLESPKAVYSSFSGGFIPLWRSDADRKARRTLREILPDTDVYVSEGIEDGATAAMAKPQERVIAAVTLGNIGKLELPEQMGRLILIGQRYKPGAETDALERAVALQQEAGREVWISPPPNGAKDVNEALQRGERAA